MREIMGLLSRLLFNDLSPLTISKGPILMRLAANLTAFFLLVLGYVLGCRVLYYYLEPYWGEALSLLAICGLLFITSFFLFILAWFLKPKTPPLTNFISGIEKTLNEIPSHEILKKVASMVSPKTVVAVFTLAAMISYFSNFKKKNI